MNRRQITWVILFALLTGMIGLVPAKPAGATVEKICIVLDPGHGGSASGTTRIVNGATLTEKECTLKVAQHAKEVLEADGRFEVWLTREIDQALSLEDRALFARNKTADVLVSLHFNSAANQSAKGAEVWQSVLPKYQIAGLPDNILSNIYEGTGLDISRGVKSRQSESRTYWNSDKNWDTSENTGVLADYYGLIKDGAKWGIPSMIVEHAFFTNAEDLAYLTSPDDEGLRALGEADAKALIDFYTGHEHVFGEVEMEYPVSCISFGCHAAHCTICKVKKDIAPVTGEVHTTEHFVDKYKVTKQATTTAAGSEEGICHYCGKTVVRQIQKLKSSTISAKDTKKSKLAKAAIKKAVKKKKKVTVTAGKVKGALGYQFLFGSNKKLTKNKKQVFSKKTKTVIKKWKAKNCYVKVRAYRTGTNGKKEYGKWSSVKRVK